MIPLVLTFEVEFGPASTERHGSVGRIVNFLACFHAFLLAGITSLSELPASEPLSRLALAPVMKQRRRPNRTGSRANTPVCEARLRHRHELHLRNRGCSMDTTFGVAVAVLCILGGAASFLAPHTISPFQEDADTTPEQAVRQVRVGGIVLFVMGCALLYAVLTANGPAEFIGV